MRIALDGRTIADHFPGIGRYTYNLASALAAALPPGDELVLLHNARQPNTRFNLAALQARTNLRLVEVGPPNFSLAEQWRIPGVLRRLGTSVYHSPYYIMPYRPGVPAVVTMYDVIPVFYPDDYSAAVRLIYNLSMRLAARTTRQVITISQASARDLQQWLGLPMARVRAIPLAADPMFVPQPPEAVARVRARYGLPETYVLYLGSNKPHKNLPRLVRAYARQRDSAPDVPLVIAGHWDERYREARQAAAPAQSSVRLIGPVAESDLPALYGGAVLFAFPSLYEGFGLPPLEAMACGTPVISSNAPALVEVAGDAALLFDPLDEAAIGAALERALRDRDLRLELSRRGRQRAQEFTWAQAARQTLEVYRALP